MLRNHQSKPFHTHQLHFHQSNNQVSLPAGNTLGITAATPENPDAFEVFKFILTSDIAPVPIQQQQQQQPIINQAQAQPQAQGQGQPQENQNPLDIRSVNQQFVDLSTRLELINRASNNIIREITKSDARLTQIASFDARLQRMEQTLQAIQRDLEGKDYRDRFNQLQEMMRSSHLTLSESLHGTVFDGKPLPTSPSLSPSVGWS